MTKKLTYEEVIKNKRLTDFEGTKEIILSNHIKHAPVFKKSKADDCNQKYFPKHL